MAKARASWSITLAGVPIQVTAYYRTAPRRSQSFKMLDPVHKQPVQSILRDVKGKDVERSATLRGVETGKVVYPLSEEAMAMIERVGRSTVVEIERFSPVGSIPLELAIESFVLVPDEKIPGSEQAVQILWNGLRSTGLAAIIDGLSLSSGARPSIFVIEATDDALVGYVMPFIHEVRTDAPDWQPEENAKYGRVFAAFIEGDYTVADYDAAVYHDTYLERRQAAIDLALAGKVEAAPAEPEEPAEVAGDLMAKLEAMLAEKAATKKSRTAAPAKTTRKPRTRSKV